MGEYPVAKAFNESLFRYEVAEYLTRAMGAYYSANDTDTGYNDEADIPKESRAFVKFVKDKVAWSCVPTSSQPS